MYSTFIAYLLWFFGGFGMLGLHRHYLGKHATGILWFFTGGGFLLGSLYDFATLTQQVQDANIKKAIYEAGMRNLNPIYHLKNANTINTSNSEKDKKPISLEQLILKVAQENKGRLTPGQVAIHGDFNLEDCRKELDRMATKGFCEMRIANSGTLVYHFAEFTPESGPDLSF